MKRHLKYLPVALLALLLAGCDNTVVPRADYETLVKECGELEARNDSLEFELQDQRLHNAYLEETIDSMLKATGQR